MDEERLNEYGDGDGVANRSGHNEPISEAELESLPILKPGTLLEPSGVYVDLNGHEPVPFKALEGQVAGSGNRYVARRDVSHELWNRLIERSVQAGAESSGDRADLSGESLGAYYRALILTR